MSGIWWTKMEHKEDFCEHFCEMSDKEIVADIRKSINSFLKQRADGADFGAKMVKKALDRITSKHESAVANGSLGGQATAANKKKSPQDDTNGNAVDDRKAATSCDQFTADGDTREDSLAKQYGSSITRDETRHADALEPSANHYATRQAKNGDATRREAGEAFLRRESGIDAPTTVSNNMRQSAKTRDNRESGRYAQPSCSPEDGNLYDQESSISTDNHQPEGLTGPSHGGSVASLEARESQARKSRQRTGGSSVRGMAKVAQPPVRSRAKNSRCPNSRDEFHAFVADNNLHEGLSEEWYAMHEDREWLDRDGKPINDWRGALYNYCTKTEKKRRTA